MTLELVQSDSQQPEIPTFYPRQTTLVVEQARPPKQAKVAINNTNEIQVTNTNQPEISPTTHNTHWHQTTLVVGRQRPEIQAVTTANNTSKKRIIDSIQPEIPTLNTHQSTQADDQITKAPRRNPPKTKHNLELKRLARKMGKCTLDEVPKKAQPNDKLNLKQIERKMKKCTLEEDAEPSCANSEKISRRKKLAPVRQKDKRTRPSPKLDPIDPALLRTDPQILAFHANYHHPKDPQSSEFVGFPVLHRVNATLFCNKSRTVPQNRVLILLILKPFVAMFSNGKRSLAAKAELKVPTCLGELDDLCAELESKYSADQDPDLTTSKSVSYGARRKLRFQFDHFYRHKMIYIRSEWFERIGEKLPCCFRDVEEIVTRLRALRAERQRGVKRAAEVEEEDGKEERVGKTSGDMIEAGLAK